MIEQIFGSVWALLYVVLTVGMVLLVLARKREPSAALGWSLAIVLLPLLGSLLFLCLGLTRLPRRLRRKVVHRAGFSDHRSAHAEPQPDDATVQVGAPWARAVPMLVALGEPPVRAGNAVSLLPQGEAAFERILAAIEAARHHVHIEMYIFRNDELGRRFLKLLVHKAQAGVEVRLLLDYVGTLARWTLLRRLRRAGGQGAVFLPLWAIGKRFAPNLRNHRKIVVCDGRVGFFGGLNVGEEYTGRKKAGRTWCDAHVEVRGPAVGDLQTVFEEDWDFATGQLLEGACYFPDMEAAGEATVQIISGGPDRDVNPVREAWLFAIMRARKRLCIASPYVIPDLAFRDGLKTAARSGVEVVVVTQSWPPDNYLAELCGCYWFEEMLEAGVRIFRYAPGMMHAKLVVADGVVAAVGSANLDNRSLALNFELAGLFAGPAEVAAVAAHFDDMLAQSREIELEAFRARSRLRRGAESLARLLAPLL